MLRTDFSSAQQVIFGDYANHSLIVHHWNRADPLLCHNARQLGYSSIERYGHHGTTHDVMRFHWPLRFSFCPKVEVDTNGSRPPLPTSAISMAAHPTLQSVR
jgi:hypothetical protein